MKKIYSLLAATVISATIGAQLYTTGFESASPASNGFVSGTVYNNTTVAFTGPAGKQWGTYFGTPSTTSAISGNQSMQMRWYTSSSNSKGYTYTNFGTDNVKSISFSAANTNGINVIVSYSVNGGSTWLNPRTYTLSTSSNTYVYTIPSNETATTGFRFKFELTYATAPTATSRLYLDDIVFSDQSLATLDTAKGKPNLVKNTIVANELIFGAAAKVSVYNAAGQVVKKAEVSENERLDVSTLSRGNYVVKGVINGRVVSQKIIKK